MHIIRLPGPGMESGRGKTYPKGDLQHCNTTSGYISRNDVTFLQDALGFIQNSIGKTIEVWMNSRASHNVVMSLLVKQPEVTSWHCGTPLG